MLVYLLTFKDNSTYVGKTSTSMNSRMSCHRRDLRTSNRLLYVKWRELGEPNVEILEDNLSKCDAKVLERDYTLAYKILGDNLNINIGDNNATGWHHSEETKKKISDNHADVSGSNNPMYGKKRSQEVKDAVSKANSVAIEYYETHPTFRSQFRKKCNREGYNIEDFEQIKVEGGVNPKYLYVKKELI